MDVPGEPGVSVREGQAEISADTPCRRCGYNLRGLREDGRCPECGTPIGLSTRGDLLRFADPAWVERLAKGIRYIIWGLIVTIIAGFIGGCLTAMTRSHPIFLQVVLVLAGLIAVYGAWLLTTPDPSGLGEDRHVTARKIVRFALLVGVLNQCLQIIIINARSPASSKPSIILLLVLGGLAGLVGTIGEMAKYYYLEKLADRIPDPQLAGRARFLCWAFGITMAFMFTGGAAFGIASAATTPAPAAPAPGATPLPLGGALGGGFMAMACLSVVFGLALTVFQVMAFFLQLRLGRRFREQAEVARGTWAAAAQGGQTPPRAPSSPAL